MFSLFKFKDRPFFKIGCRLARVASGKRSMESQTNPLPFLAILPMMESAASGVDTRLCVRAGVSSRSVLHDAGNETHSRKYGIQPSARCDYLEVNLSSDATPPESARAERQWAV